MARVSYRDAEPIVYVEDLPASRFSFGLVSHNLALRQAPIERANVVKMFRLHADQPVALCLHDGLVTVGSKQGAVLTLDERLIEILPLREINRQYYLPGCLAAEYLFMCEVEKSEISLIPVS